jgi:hypothetical protein
MAAVLQAPNQWSYCCIFLPCFVHNVSATVSYDRKELLGFRTAITDLELDKYFLLNESDANDLLQIPDKAHIPVIA